MGECIKKGKPPFFFSTLFKGEKRGKIFTGGFMLKLSARHLFAAKAIIKPQGFLRNNGFSSYMANDIVMEKARNFKLDAMEKLCLVLNCTPHDLLVWEPDASIAEPSKFELSKLMRQKEIIKLSEQLRGLTIEEIEDVNRYVEEKRKSKL